MAEAAASRHFDGIWAFSTQCFMVWYRLDLSNLQRPIDQGCLPNFSHHREHSVRGVQRLVLILSSIIKATCPIAIRAGIGHDIATLNLLIRWQPYPKQPPTRTLDRLRYDWVPVGPLLMLLVLCACSKAGFRASWGHRHKEFAAHRRLVGSESKAAAGLGLPKQSRDLFLPRELSSFSDAQR